jgi:hypothetical protein
MAETTLNKKMRAFDDEVALTVAPFYLVHMLQRTLPARFIAPCLRTKTDKCQFGDVSSMSDLPVKRTWLGDYEYMPFPPVWVFAQLQSAHVSQRHAVRPGIVS